MLEVKGTLAKLLAQEDLIVEQKQVETAMFDVDKRILTLPLWEKASDTIIDMLISHEVGHALYTPNEWDYIGKIPQSYVNVVEDVRIEKLMKRRYAGLPKTFYNGYREINKEDFFQLQGADIDEFQLIDRINLHFKVGNFWDIPFSAQEIQYRDMCDTCETFEEVLKVADAIAKYQQEQIKDQLSQTATKSADLQLDDQGTGSSHQSSFGESTENNTAQDADAPTNETTQDNGQESDDQDESSNATPQSTQGGTKGGKAHVEDLEAVTDSILNESIQNLVDPSSAPTEYVTIPELDIDKVIVPVSDWVNLLESHWAEKGDHLEFGEVDAEYAEYKKSSLKEVNYLVKEFEMKKSASAYARQSTSKTGVLDTSKLFQYKYNDDIFKRITVTPDGKNHGLIFNLDWSGSMSNILLPTMKQLLNLIQFCVKTNIPFEVYAFTSEYNSAEGNRQKGEEKEGELIVEKFNLINFASSTLKTKDLQKVMKYMYRLAFAFKSWGRSYSVPFKLYLSGTPLNEAIIAMRQILPEFQRKNKIEKVHVINLTDGEACSMMKRSKWGNYDYGDPDKLVSRHIAGNQLRDRKLGRIYEPFTHTYYNGGTEIFIQNLRDNFPESSVILIRVLSGSDFSRVSYNWEYDQKEKNKAEWRKHKSFVDFNSAYTRALYILNTAMDANVDFEVKEDARKQDISRAFKKSLKNKKTSKRVLNEFITSIA